ncbi:Arb2 domain-containing protein [Apiosordaria backusii]|uniref:Arb2 domain-containing protein n=1 Tax=Apiosordaria backusii TaxID=314023 RepID=A0AA40BNH0_9PEZI|nr:Arb2 domain-containing protein [Apiosordaria backusii]
MFRRRWSGLPADPVFPADLSELGYFINEDDEIRSLENADYYFKYFLTKNERYNGRQRFAFNEAMSKIIHTRLNALNLVPLRLPLGTNPDQPHVPIRITPDLPKHSRVVLIIGEETQQFGVLAHRVLGGKGGITQGSVLNLVRALQSQPSSATDPSPPGIIIANPGELFWWPEGKRGLTPSERHDIPLASAVHYGRVYDKTKNGIPKNLNCGEHVECVFEEVVEKLVGRGAKVDVIAVGNSAEEVEGYLNDEGVWGRVGQKMGAMVVLGGFYHSGGFRCEGFRRFMQERARAYAIHQTPLDNPIAGSLGNPAAVGFTSFGCPAYSAGEANMTELMLIEAHDSVLKWLEKVALEGEAYKNEDVQIFGDDDGAIPEDMLHGWGEGGENGEENVEEVEVKVEAGEIPALQDVKVDGGNTPKKEVAATVSNESSPGSSQDSKVAAAEKEDEENVVLKVKDLKVTVEDEE